MRGHGEVLLSLPLTLLILSAVPAAGRKRWSDREGFQSMRLKFGKESVECPCRETKFCEPITRTNDVEIFGFAGATSNASSWDWEAITTVAWNANELMCLAHEHGARAIAAAPSGMPLTSNETVRTEWVQRTVSAVKSSFLDGITFDYESPMAWNSSEREYYVAIVRETTLAMHAALPGSQVSVCVAWSPDDIDGRAYDVAALAGASDLLYVMSYDTRSQIFDRCIASANSPASRASYGLQRYIDLGISPSKLILGTPWYGYDYPCLETPELLSESSYCTLRSVPFRSVNCSDAAGRERTYADMMNVIVSDPSASTVARDSSTQTPYFNYVVTNDTDGSRIAHQIWFDDAQSSAAKYDVALKLGVRGVGPFCFGDLAYDTALARKQASDMWNALATFKEKRMKNLLLSSNSTLNALI